MQISDNEISIEPAKKKKKTSSSVWDYTETVTSDNCENILATIKKNRSKSINISFREFRTNFGFGSGSRLDRDKQDKEIQRRYSSLTQALIQYALSQKITVQITSSIEYLLPAMKMIGFTGLSIGKNNSILLANHFKFVIPSDDVISLLDTLCRYTNQNKFRVLRYTRPTGEYSSSASTNFQKFFAIIQRSHVLEKLVISSMRVNYKESLALVDVIIQKQRLTFLELDSLLLLGNKICELLLSRKQLTSINLVLNNSLKSEERAQIVDLLNQKKLNFSKISIRARKTDRSSSTLTEKDDVFYDYKRTEQFVRFDRDTNSYERTLAEYSEFKLKDIYPGIDLSHYNFNSDTIDPIIHWVKANKKIEAIKIVSNATFTDEHAAKFISAIKKYKNIVKLEFSKMGLSTRAANALVLFLSENTLAFLNIAHNHFNNDDLFKLSQVIKNNSSLVKLSIRGNSVTSPALINIAKNLRSNTTLTHFDYIDYNSGSNHSYFMSYLASVTAQELIVAFDETLRVGYRKKKRVPFGTRNSALVSLQSPKLLDKSVRSVEARFQKFIEKNKSQSRELLDATRSGAFNIFKEKLELGASCYTTDQGDFLSHITVKFGHAKLLKELLRRGVNPRLRNSKGQTVLELAQELQVDVMIKILRDPSRYQQALFSPISSKKNQPATKAAEKKFKQGKHGGIKRKQPEKQKPEKQKPGKSSETKDRVNSDDDAMVLFKKQKTLVPAVPVALLDDSLAKDMHLDFFFQAIHAGNSIQMKRFFQKSMLQVAYGDNGEQALHCAVEAVQLTSINLLLKLDPDTEQVTFSGLTPLALCVKNIDEASDTREGLIKKLKILRTLLVSGANVNHIYTNDTYGEITPLMQAVIGDNYRAMKLLATKNCNFSWSNDEGTDVLKLIITMKRIRFLNRLLIMPRLEPAQIKKTRVWVKPLTKNHDDKVYYKQINNMLLRRLRLKVPGNHAGIQWVKNLNVVWKHDFSTKSSLFHSDGESCHEHLLAQNSLLRVRLEQEDDDEVDNIARGNPVTACVSFIISIPLAMGKKKIKEIRIDLDFVDEFHVDDADEGELDRIKRRIQLGLGKDYENYRGDKYHPCDTAKLEELYADDENHTMFDQWFHHGEASLVTHFESDKFIEDLVSKLTLHKDFQKGCKVLFLRIMVFSGKYACSNCEVGLLANQHPMSNFMTKLPQYLKRANIRVSEFHPLPVITSISTIEPYQSDPISFEEHDSFIVDLRNWNNNLILSKDLFAEEPKLTQYQSSKPS